MKILTQLEGGAKVISANRKAIEGGLLKPGCAEDSINFFAEASGSMDEPQQVLTEAFIYLLEAFVTRRNVKEVRMLARELQSAIFGRAGIENEAEYKNRLIPRFWKDNLDIHGESEDIVDIVFPKSFDSSGNYSVIRVCGGLPGVGIERGSLVLVERDVPASDGDLIVWEEGQDYGIGCGCYSQELLMFLIEGDEPLLIPAESYYARVVAFCPAEGLLNQSLKMRFLEVAG